MLAQIEAGWADQIADVLDEKQVDAVEIQPMERLVDQMRVEMASAAGGDLDRRDTLGADAFGVVLGFEIALDHRDAQLLSERFDGCLKQTGLAGTGRGHEVQRQDAMVIEMFAVVGGLMVVLGQQSLEYRDGGPAIGGLGMVPIALDQMFVTGCDVAAAGIAHFYQSLPAKMAVYVIPASRVSPFMGLVDGSIQVSRYPAAHCWSFAVILGRLHAAIGEPNFEYQTSISSFCHVFRTCTIRRNMNPIDLLRPLWRALPIDIHWRQRIKHFLLQGPLARLGSRRMAVLDAPAWDGDWSVLLPPLDAPADRLLVIDWKPPTPDLDSGSYRLRLILDLLLESGFAVDFIGDREAESPDYAEVLRELGIRTLVGQSAALDHLAVQGHRYSQVWISRPEVAEVYLASVRALAPQALVIYDTVDLHWVRFERGAAFASDPTELLERAHQYRRLELANARAADRVIAITADERARLLQEDPGLDVRVLPNVHPVVDKAAPPSARRDLFFIGGFQHEPNVDAMLYFAAEILPLVRAELPEVRLRIVGSHMPESIRQLDSPAIEAVGYVAEVESCFAQARLFVAPLRHGAGMKGKIGQSLSQGLPVVTTAIGAEGMGLTHEREALIADDPRAFAAAVVRLYRDDALWSRLSEAGLTLMRACYSGPVVAEQLRALLTEPVASPGSGQSVSITDRTAKGTPHTARRPPCETDRRVLILGIYLPGIANHAATLSRELLGARDWEVDLRWASVGACSASAPLDPELEALTRWHSRERVPKFVLLNRLLAEIEIERYRYLLVVDDDIELPPGFLDRFLAIQEVRDFTLAQPARTHDSYTDHQFVNQLMGVESRCTRFVEIGPLFSLRRDGFASLLPFDEDAPMGWGLDFVWPVVLEHHGRRLGIVDATPVRHALRKPVSTYDYTETQTAMQVFLARRSHLTLSEACIAGQTYPLTGPAAIVP
jgi:glycosyltransferase involved in cell wall biosynthesis